MLKIDFSQIDAQEREAFEHAKSQDEETAKMTVEEFMQSRLDEISRAYMESYASVVFQQTQAALSKMPVGDRVLLLKSLKLDRELEKPKKE